MILRTAALILLTVGSIDAQYYPGGGGGGGGGGSHPAYTTVTFSATPVLTSSTLTTTGATVGQDIAFHICQDGTGGRTFVWPTNVTGASTIDGTASGCSNQIFRYDGTNAIAVSPMQVTGVTGSALVLSGSTSGTTIVQPSAAASGTVTLPAVTDTLVARATTDTLTNKTYDTAGTGNVFKLSGTTVTGPAGTGAKVVAATAIGTSGNCMQWAATGAGDAGAPCGSGSGGAAGSTLFSATANAGPSNTATETSVIGTITGSKTIPANTFVNGTLIQVSVSGLYSTPTVADALTIKLKCGSTVLGTASLTLTAGVLSNGVWRVLADIAARGSGASGTLMLNTIAEFTGSALTPSEAKISNTSAVAYDFTTSCAFDVTGTWGAAQAGETLTGTTAAAWIPGAPVSSVFGQTGAVGNLTGDVTTSGSSAATIAANAVTSAKSAVVNTRRTCTILIGADNGSALANTDLAQPRWCYIPYAATVVEVMVAGDAGTPSVIVGRNHAGTVANLVSSALATGAIGALACSNTGGTTGLDAATTCGATLQNTAIAAGDWLDLVSGTAGGTAKRMSISVTYTVN